MLLFLTGISLAADPMAYVPRVPNANEVVWAPEDCTAQRLAVLQPQPAVALGLSALVGFGTGHFYAGRSEAGLGFLAADSAALVTLGAGLLADDPRAKAAGVGIGAAMVGIVRLIEMGSAPSAARKSALDTLDACGL